MFLSNYFDRLFSAAYFPKQKRARRGRGWGWVKSLKHDLLQCQLFFLTQSWFFFYYLFFFCTEVDLCVSLCVSKSDQREGLESRTQKPEGLSCFSNDTGHQGAWQMVTTLHVMTYGENSLYSPHVKCIFSHTFANIHFSFQNLCCTNWFFFFKCMLCSSGGHLYFNPQHSCSPVLSK